MKSLTLQKQFYVKITILTLKQKENVLTTGQFFGISHARSQV